MSQTFTITQLHKYMEAQSEGRKIICRSKNCLWTELFQLLTIVLTEDNCFISQKIIQSGESTSTADEVSQFLKTF